MAVAAPVIEVEMADWVALGGRNSGIVGNDAHTSGFHRAASEVPATDYSRRRDPNGADGPYVNWSYACAGDFWHGDDPRLLAMHRRLLARLEAGELPMICEFIGQPWPDQPVLYWSRWGGRSTYQGPGHGTWSHVSWYRSRANQRAHLWQEIDDMSAQAEFEVKQVYTGLFVGGPSMGRAVDPDGSGAAKAGNSLVAKLDYVMGRLDAVEKQLATPTPVIVDPAAVAAALPAELADRIADRIAARLAE